MAPLYDYECDTCGLVVELQHPISGPDPLSTNLDLDKAFVRTTGGVTHQVLHILEDNSLPVHPLGHDGLKTCGVMTKLISAPALKLINRGNHDFAQRERTRIRKRNKEHWDKTGRTEAIERAESKGLPVPTGWLHKAVRKMKGTT